MTLTTSKSRSYRYIRCTGAFVFLLLVSLWTPLADASPVTFSFTGSVIQTNFDPNDPFSGAIGFATGISGTYTFESTTTDAIPSISSGSYTSIPGALSVTIGGIVFSAADLLNIGVANNSGPIDLYTVLAQKSTGADTFEVELFLQDDQGVVFSNDLLPLNAPSFAGFEIATFALRTLPSGTIDGNQVEILGQLSSLRCANGCVASPVPEPGSFALVVAGLGLLGLLRKQHRR